MKKLIIKGIVGIALLALAVLFQGTLLAHAASNGLISGTLLDGSNKNAPLANQSVTLQMAQMNSSHDIKTVKTDGSGHFSFSGLDTDQTISYVVYARYQGAQYVSSIVTLNTKPSQNIDLQVYEATQSTKSIVVSQATVLMQRPDTARGTITVSEVFSFQNLSPRTYVGSLDASKGKPNALLFSLPTGIRNITLGNGFEGYQVIQVNNGFASDAALLPGVNEFSFSYEIPYTAPAYVFSYETQYPTAQMEFLVDPTLHATSGVLNSAGMINASNQTYHAFKTNTGLAASTKINVTLDSLPTPQSQSSSAPSFNATVIWLVATIIVMCAIIALTWFLYRSKRKANRRTEPDVRGQKGAAIERAESKPVLAAESPAMDEHEEGTSERAEKEKERQGLLEELLVLDKAHEAGDLAKESYEQQRKEVKARLRSLLRELEASRR